MIVGGMGSGKSTLCSAVDKIFKVNHVHPGTCAVKVPMTLIETTHPHLLKLPQNIYIKTVLEHRTIKTNKFDRDETDDYGKQLERKYGNTFLADLVGALADPDLPNLIESVPCASNIRCLQERGWYILGLTCSFDTQVKRRLDNPKPIDPTDRKEMVNQVKRTNAYYEVPQQLSLADKVYDTEQFRSTSSEVVNHVISRLRAENT